MLWHVPYKPEPEQEAGSDKQQGQISRNVEIPQLQVDAQSVYNRMINYIVPEEELAPVLLKEQLAVYIDFPARWCSGEP